MKILSEPNHGSEQFIQPEEHFRIELTSNPSTGYIWEVTKIDPSMLSMIYEDQIRYTSEKIGLGSLMIFEFEALKSGETDLELIYRRTWDPNSVMNRFYIKIRIQ